MLICKHSSQPTMVFNQAQIALLLLASSPKDIHTLTPPPPKMKPYSQDQIQFRKEMKRPRQSKNHKRYRQTQPRNRGTNHTLLRKGNTW